MTEENIEHICSVCGHIIKSKNVFSLVGAIKAHLYNKHKTSWRDEGIKEEYIKEYNKIISDKNKDKVRGADYVIAKNNKLLDKLGLDEYQKLPKCAICGLVSGQLYSHIPYVHNISLEEYTEKYGAELASKSYLEDHKNRFIGDKNPMYGKGCSENSPFSVEFYVKKGYSLEEAIKLKENKIRETNDVRESSLTVEYYEKKFDVDNLTAKEMLKDRQATNSVENIAKRLNISIEEARKHRDKITKKWVKNLNEKDDEELMYINQKKVGSNISKGSIDFFDELIKYCNISRKECLYGEGAELAICRNENISDMQLKKYFLYDFTYKTKIIEFNGDLYHANPIKYLADDKPFENISFITTRREWTAEQVWNFDTYKNKVATDHGYEMMVVWEYDTKHNLRDSLEKCKKYLLGENHV